MNGMALNGMAHQLAAMNGMGTAMAAVRPPAPKAAPRAPLKWEVKPGLKPGDWTCPGCGANVYASKQGHLAV